MSGEASFLPPGVDITKSYFSLLSLHLKTLKMPKDTLPKLEFPAELLDGSLLVMSL